MSVDYSDFLGWAESEMSASELGEFAIRNASSRAYYALYHAAAVRARELELPITRVEGAGSHEALIHAIRVSSPKGKSLADDMERVKRFRSRCDYDLSCELSIQKAHKQVAESRRLIGMLSRL